MIDKPSPAEVQAERAQAMQEYQSDLDAVKARTAKLRAERLAREARGEQPVKMAPKPLTAAPKPAKAKAPAKKAAAKKSPKKSLKSAEAKVAAE